MDGLKSLRDLKVSEAVPQILPLLHSGNDHVVRDACRTLAVVGDKSVIPEILPLTASPRWDVQADADAAIKALQAKP